MMKKLKERLNNQKGLTLIELLAVIVVLGIIAAIAIPAIGNIIDNSRYGAIKSDAIMVLNAAKLYHAEEGKKPATVADLGEYLEGSISIESAATIGRDDVGAFTLSGTGKKDDIEVTFTNATIADINSAPSKYSDSEGAITGNTTTTTP